MAQVIDFRPSRVCGNPNKAVDTTTVSAEPLLLLQSMQAIDHALSVLRRHLIDETKLTSDRDSDA